MWTRWKDFSESRSVFFTIGVVRSVEIFELAEMHVWGSEDWIAPPYVCPDSFMKTDEYKIYAVKRNRMCTRFYSFLFGAGFSVPTLCSRTVCCPYWITSGNSRYSSVFPDVVAVGRQTHISNCTGESPVEIYLCTIHPHTPKWPLSDWCSLEVHYIRKYVVQNYKT
jgi:hypothetical protein